MAHQQHKQYRLPGHTYAESDSYFITICTKDRHEAFGEVNSDAGVAMISLSPIGQALSDEINRLEQKYINLKLGKWQIMPDHVHLVLHLGDENENAPRRVPTCPTGLQPLNPGSVSSVANHLKGHVTKWAKANSMDFCWQARFHDRVIRDMSELTGIEHYIAGNPDSWLRQRMPHNNKIISHP